MLLRTLVIMSTRTKTQWETNNNNVFIFVLLFGSFAVPAPYQHRVLFWGVLGALVMYIMSMASLFKLRATEPGLQRPYKAPFYPVLPGIALVFGLVCLGALVYFNPIITGLFLGLMAVAWVYFALTSGQRDAAPADEMLGTAK